LFGLALAQSGIRPVAGFPPPQIRDKRSAGIVASRQDMACDPPFTIDAHLQVAIPVPTAADPTHVPTIKLLAITILVGDRTEFINEDLHGQPAQLLQPLPKTGALIEGKCAARNRRIRQEAAAKAKKR
jgi:hypothetical protein